ncbi:transporter substrate-binding domain-containing protein [Desulfovibrio sp. JC022]|uniref:ATP-binding protein n=1 Tax=Desulfovibrio sp. JC022 TaxID=2593642 RepID=UPI0013D219B8|nr:transporter substrate-binding domain-containing protein [Desulfovibrio sp. JC022]NDV23320.1 transporter substrate-binding domain-containing protein [Desulfovibrio sp. JC022]
MRVFPALFLMLTILWTVLAGPAAGNETAALESDHAPALIKLGTCMNSSPYEFVDNKGNYSGITADYVRLLSKKLGREFKRTRCTDQERMFLAVELGDVDFIPLVERTPELLKNMDFIFPYIQQPTVIVTREKSSFGKTLSSLKGKTIALPYRAGVRTYINKLYGNNISLLSINGPPSSTLEAVLIGDADAAVLDLAVAANLLERERFEDMEISGFTDYVAVRGMAVRKGMELLRTELLTALNSVSPEEQSEIHERWFTPETVPFYKDDRLIAWTLIISGLCLGGFALILGWNTSLKSVVRKRTATLEAVNNMLMQSITASTEQDTCEICLARILEAIQAELAFLAVQTDTGLDIRCTSPGIDFDFLPIHTETVKETCEDQNGQIDLNTCAGRNYGIPRHLMLVRFRNSNREQLVAGIARDEIFSDESVLVFKSLVPTFEQVLSRKRAELRLLEKDKQILRAQRMESLGTMAGGIAHDFNNILGAIIANGEMIEMFHQPEDKGMTEKVSAILTAAYRGRDVVRQVLDFARPRNESAKPLKLDGLIKETESLLRASLPQTCKIDLDLEDGVVVMANSTQISQVVMNLCMNAAQAMDKEGGEIKIGLRTGNRVPQDLISGTDIDPERAVMMRVRDNGPGMEKEVLDRIFDPFFTTKPPGEGTGLGLAVVAGIVTSYGGRIKVDSTPGKGTEFSISFPMCEDIPADDAEDFKDSEHGSGRILFVDDQQDLLESYTEVLEKFGYSVNPFSDPLLALAAFKNNPGSYSLMLSDYNMPGMSGDELSRKVMEIRPELPVVLCTGYSSRFDESKAEGLGLAALLKKPVSIRELNEAVAKFIDLGEK